MRIDRDLQSTQEARILIENAREGQKILRTYTQDRIDRIVTAMAEAIRPHALELAELACQETGFGVPQDKALKNRFASEFLYEYIKDMKTVGIIKEDLVHKTMDIGVPAGVVVALLPSTNPTSTAIYTTLIAIKAGNAIVFSPHPKASKCTARALEIMMQAAAAAGAPEDIISYLHTLSPEGTETLMKHPDTNLILSNTADHMNEIAHYAGKPVINGGPSNGPAFIERTANVKQAVYDIIRSKTFDNGLLCSSEQSIVAEEVIADEVREELKKNKAYFMSHDESERLASIFYNFQGRPNTEIVGKSAVEIAHIAGFDVPQDTTVLISEQQYVSPSNPYCKEKLCPVLAFFVEKNWMFACEKCIELLLTEGQGHTLVIHSNDEAVIKEFALKKPVSRMLVNTTGAFGGIGLTTYLPPALILSTGMFGGGFTADNISPLNLMNIRKVGYGVRNVDMKTFREVPRAYASGNDDADHWVSSTMATSQVEPPCVRSLKEEQQVELERAVHSTATNLYAKTPDEVMVGGYDELLNNLAKHLELIAERDLGDCV